MADKKSTERSSAYRAYKITEPFLQGGLSGMTATCFIQPIDMIKVRIQLLGEGVKGADKKGAITIAKEIIKNEGALGLYKGLGAALLRQATYTTTRFGVFNKTLEILGGGKNTTFTQKTIAGMAAGAIGSIVGTPADVCLIRMQADATMPPDQRRNYKGVFDALIRIVKEEGVTQGLFKGCVPVVVRATSLNVGMLTMHDQIFESSKNYTNNYWLRHLIAKAGAGFFASAFSLPFDFVKTRIQKQKPDAKGQMPYKNMIHCFIRVANEEGFIFYRGFLTYYVRIAPHAMITLAVMDILKDACKKAGL